MYQIIKISLPKAIKIRIWIRNNKKWVFSGIGTTIIFTCLPIFYNCFFPKNTPSIPVTSHEPTLDTIKPANNFEITLSYYFLNTSNFNANQTIFPNKLQNFTNVDYEDQSKINKNQKPKPKPLIIDNNKYTQFQLCQDDQYHKSIINDIEYEIKIASVDENKYNMPMIAFEFYSNHKSVRSFSIGERKKQNIEIDGNEITYEIIGISKESPICALVAFYPNIL